MFVLVSSPSQAFNLILIFYFNFFFTLNENKNKNKTKIKGHYVDQNLRAEKLASSLCE